MDLLRATFPGGSITGCPKIRSMEIIDEMETDRRHVYTGSIGYVSFHGTMDLSIAIRTATVCEGRVMFSVGGGIVYDSDPAAEYQETLDKGETLMKAFTGSAAGRQSQEKNAIWVDGRLWQSDTASLPVMSRGVQYGAGLFESLRVERGEAPFLSHHLARLQRSATALFGLSLPDFTWEAIITQLVEANGLAGKTAAVKIMVSQGAEGSRACHVVLTARPYTHRLNVLGKPGLSVVTFPSPRTSPLADHKSLNYLVSLKARDYAAGLGADEALLLNGDGSVSELATANIIALSGDRALLPASGHVLPGVMQSLVIPLLQAWGYRVEEERLGVGDLYSMDSLIATNALMGAVPIMALDGNPLVVAKGLCSDLNHHLGIRLG